MKLFYILILLVLSCKKNDGLVLNYQDQNKSADIEISKSYQIVGDKMRVDLQMNGLDTSMYFSAKKKMFVVAIHPIKKIVPGDTLKGNLNLGENQDTDLKMIDQFREVSGYKCQVFEGIHQKKVVYRGCLASYQTLGMSKEEIQTYQMMTKLFGELAQTPIENLEGVIVENEIFDDQENVTTRSVLISVKKMNIDDSIFDSPKGYETL